MKCLLPFALAAAVLVAGCGSDSGSSSAANVTAVAATGAAADRDAMKHEDAMKGDQAMKSSGTKLKVVDSEYGSVVANGRGEALYLFDREQRGKSECYGACAKAWPPVLTKGKPRAAGAAASLLGTTKRRNGKLQVTYAGQPLYYYVGDSPGTILCHDVDEFGGTWLVVQPDGSPAGQSG